jgi:Ca2+-binding EF-hand superfamily protein
MCKPDSFPNVKLVNSDVFCGWVGDERCRDYDCASFTCRALQDDLPFKKKKPCELYGRSLMEDSICDERPGKCLAGTDPDCNSTEEYIKKLRRFPESVQYLSHAYAAQPGADELCKQITVLERCGACRSATHKCSKLNPTTQKQLQVKDVCNTFKRAKQLWRTPICDWPADSSGSPFELDFRPSCDCVPKFFMDLPHWKLGVVIWGLLTLIAWIAVIVIFRKLRYGFGEFGIAGATTAIHSRFKAEPNNRQEIAFKLMERQLGKRLSHGHLKTWKHKPFTLLPDNFSARERGTLSVHNDYVSLNTVAPKGCCCCPGAKFDSYDRIRSRWCCGADEDEYYCLHKDTSFIETNMASNQILLRLSTVFLSLAFAFLFLSHIGSVIEYFSARSCRNVKNDPTAGERLNGVTCFENGDKTLVKWVGFLACFLSHVLFRVLASCCSKAMIHIGVPWGGSSRGASNPHGGTSPFYIKVKSRGDCADIVQLLRTAKRASSAGIPLSNHAQVVQRADGDLEQNDESAERKLNLETIDVETGQESIRDHVESPRSDGKKMPDGEAAKIKLIAGVFSVADDDGNGFLSEDELRTVIPKLGVTMSVEDIMTRYGDKTGNLGRAQFFDVMNALLDPSFSLGDAQKENFVQKFKQFDSSNQGFISFDQCKEALKELSAEQLQEWGSQKHKLKKAKPPLWDDASAASKIKLEELVTSLDSDGDGVINLAEFLMIIAHELKEYNDKQYAAIDFCPYTMQSINLDFVPWGAKTSVWTAHDMTIAGQAGLAGNKYLSDKERVSIEVPKLRWMKMEQNVGIFNSFYGMITEAFVIYGLVLGLRVLEKNNKQRWKFLVDCDETEGSPHSTSFESPIKLCASNGQIAGTIMAIYLLLRLTYQLCRNRATVKVHAVGVPMATMSNPDKSALPVSREMANPLTREFLLRKGVSKHAKTRAITQVVSCCEDCSLIDFSPCKHLCTRCSESHRVLLIGNTHWTVERSIGGHEDFAETEESMIKPPPRPGHLAEDDALERLPSLSSARQLLGSYVATSRFPADDHIQSKEGEIQFAVGDTISVTSFEPGEGWWTGEILAHNKTFKGKFPSALVDEKMADAAHEFKCFTEVMKLVCQLYILPIPVHALRHEQYCLSATLEWTSFMTLHLCI